MVKGILFVVCFFTVLIPSAQIKHPKASPFTTLSQDVGLANIKVAYSRPAVRGRKIFGDLVPYGRIWRVGANESTKITFSNDVIIDGSTLQKGTYALYAFPEVDSWEVVFHKNTAHWGDGREDYNPAEDALRVLQDTLAIPGHAIDPAGFVPAYPPAGTEALNRFSRSLSVAAGGASTERLSQRFRSSSLCSERSKLCSAKSGWVAMGTCTYTF